MLLSISIIIAYIFDRLIGDPKALPHPVVLIGNCISKLEELIRKSGFKNLKMAGLLFPLLIVGGTYLVVSLLLELSKLVHPFLFLFIQIILISSTIATKGLADAGLGIYHLLIKKDLEQARYSLSMIVGRDTENLGEVEITRGTVETVAENIVDAIISPLFFALIGGAPLAMAYRATNTLDSMIGYKNEKYKDLGWASARLDDILNFIPARITGLLLIVASLLLRLDAKKALTIIIRDAKLHPSPNSGIPESAVAGALQIQLGGTNYYKGIPSHRAVMGDSHRPLQADDILKTVKMMKTSVNVFIGMILLGVLVGVLV
ncbi:cobalamin biosynthesis protein CobD [Schinkia azotoformans MEV2011]|uniref:Cobalamin biosynthesis protein CobD n=1 Tax=Schinkia azotoformans MEV2011 TaxID=1348973 RepID=A0A072NNY6_SCHAZ|nr:adenosylcobinamide-phosphate synthase CbiB [Schinkia azotoformans]KEF38977.1 cobalamin biosynthesis protein CobD [Schinkia azotoformans MEV2011]MEC1694460.1 adenosylcobinamide-phosphate synthase CbiB [Schinkia azotoformans]MEC1714499.1 adenosylcobinamide-phosphate synthase CbiB [Schinkia azotoformans]MEC1723271.1 adenosylcobinamide-phosphate synthase CbiB [Schinkia azotoformans]MEC1740406.1 adenosylcobinamide-phosphate synthase CbiB [Schinkia azotoformans]